MSSSKNAGSDDDPDQCRTLVDTDEFLFPGVGLSVLLIHGLTGTPYEMRFLGRQIAAAGMRACGVRLAGHGGSPEELAATNHDHWYESVVDGFERLRSFGDPVAVVGLSAGALLAARLAVDQGDEVAALAMLAPAMFLPLWTRAALRAVARCGEWTGRIYLQGGASDIHDTAAREVHPRTRLMPLSAPGSLMDLSAMLRTRLGKLDQPTLIVHGRRDHVCPLRPNLSYLMKHIGSADKRAVILEESFHVITVDTEKERVAAEVIEFLNPLRVTAARALCG